MLIPLMFAILEYPSRRLGPLLRERTSPPTVSDFDKICARPISLAFYFLIFSLSGTEDPPRQKHVQLYRQFHVDSINEFLEDEFSHFPSKNIADHLRARAFAS